MTIEEHISAPDALLLLTDALMPPRVLFAGAIRAVLFPVGLVALNLSLRLSSKGRMLATYKDTNKLP